MHTEGQEAVYRIATYSPACTAYVRDTLRRAIAAQGYQTVWPTAEYVSAARGMVGVSYTMTPLSDEWMWRLTETDILTIHYALGWRRYRRATGHMDQCIGEALLQEWEQIENEIYRVAQYVWHNRGLCGK